MDIKAAVTHSKNKEFKIETVTLDPPKYGEVLIRIASCGICHTDISIRDQYKPTPLPAVLGHEGTGIVESIGEGVRNISPGDHVILSFNSCGECDHCREGHTYACHHSFQLNFMGKMADGTHRISQDGQSISSFFGQSSFAAYATVSHRNIVKVDKDIPLKILTPLGCGVMTGAGAVFNKLKPGIGSTIAVFGCGTVGLSAIMAAKVASCSKIIGIDIHDNRLELARDLGATHTIHSKLIDPLEKIREITTEGVHYAIDTSAIPTVIEQAFNALKVSGTALTIGGAPLGAKTSIDLNVLLRDRTISGILFGSSVPQVFVPKLIELYRMGVFPFDKLIQYYSFEDINNAVHDIEKGQSIKPVLVM